jgi:hypothetical protein
MKAHDWGKHEWLYYHCLQSPKNQSTEHVAAVAAAVAADEKSAVHNRSAFVDAVAGEVVGGLHETRKLWWPYFFKKK